MVTKPLTISFSGASKDQVWEACHRAIRELGYEVRSFDGRLLEFNTGRSMSSWAGQDVFAIAKPVGSGASLTIDGYMAASRIGQSYDWGEKGRVIKKFATKVTDVLPGIMTAERGTNQGSVADTRPEEDSARLARVAAEANAAPYASPGQPPEGFMLFGVGRSAPFAGRVGEFAPIEELVSALIRDSDPRSSTALRWSADRYPNEWSDRIDEAVGLKRAGEFLASVEAYIALTRSSGVVYSGIVGMLYKSVAASGALRAANRLLSLGQQIFESDPKSLETLRMYGGPSAFESHRSELEEASGSEDLLEEYLRGISGNVNYHLTRAYADAVRDLRTD